jgi:hypothetical protein
MSNGKLTKKLLTEEELELLYKIFKFKPVKKNIEKKGVKKKDDAS